MNGEFRPTMNVEIPDESIIVAEDDVSKTLFHRALVSLDQTTSWPAWRILAIIIAVSCAVGVTWLFVSGQPQTAALATAIFLAFVILDLSILVVLPLLSISFGTWKSQIIVLMFPRALVAVSSSLISLLMDPIWALAIMIGVELVGTSLIFWGSFFEVRRLQLTELKITSDAMDPKTEPVRLLHISDLHVEKLTSREEELINFVNQAKPDVIVLTGDYLNLSFVHDKNAQSAVKKLLAQLSAPGGVYAVLGGPTVDDRSVVPGLFENLPVRLLVNDWVEIDLKSGQRIVLLGLDCTQQMSIDKKNFSQLLDASPNGIPQVLLYHTPDMMPEVARHGIDLYLCGHTHGGQIRIPIYGAILTSSQYGKRYEMGLYVEEDTSLYVSRGIGLEGLGAPRIRLFAPPEMTLITIAGK